MAGKTQRLCGLRWILTTLGFEHIFAMIGSGFSELPYCLKIFWIQGVTPLIFLRTST